MEKKDVVRQILKLIGGDNNYTAVTHCITRLRFEIINKNIVKQEEIERIEDVLGVQYVGNQLQIVLGTNVADYYTEFVDQFKKQDQVDHSSNKKSIFSKMIDGFTQIILPTTKMLGAAGIIKGILALLSLDLITADSDIYIVINMIGDAIFYFIPVIIGFTAAKTMKINEYMGAALGAILMYPVLAQGAVATLPALDFFGISIPYVSYSGTVVPVILGVIAMKYIYQVLHRFIPDALEIIVTTSFTLLITAIITLAFLAPLGNYLSNYLGQVLMWIFSWAGPFAGLLMGSSFAVLVLTGVGLGMIPLSLQNLAVYQYDFFLLPYMIYSNINQGIAALAASYKIKDSSLKSAALGTGITAVLGITEPAMFTVNIKYKKPFYCAIIGSGVAGFLSALFGVKQFFVAGGGIPAIVGFISNDYKNNLVFALISLAVGVLVTFILTYLLTSEKDIEKVDSVQKQKIRVIKDEKKEMEPFIYSVGNGKLIELKNVPDKMFSNEIIGIGYAVDIIDGCVYAPVNGTVVSIYPTRHAIGIKADNGVEVLIHIGVETVNLGEGVFKSKLNKNDRVKQGDLLITYDKNALVKTGVYTPTIVVVTNTQEYDVSIQTSKKNLTIQDKVLNILKKEVSS